MLCVKFKVRDRTRVIRLRVIDGPNARDQIGFCAFHSFLVEVILVPRATRLNLTKKRRALGTRMNECWLHTCDACVITTCRLGLQAPLVARNEERWSRSYLHLKFYISAADIIFKCHSFHGRVKINSTNWPAPNVWVFIAQMVEHCSANVAAMGSNPV